MVWQKQADAAQHQKEKKKYIKERTTASTCICDRRADRINYSIKHFSLQRFTNAILNSNNISSKREEFLKR